MTYLFASQLKHSSQRTQKTTARVNVWVLTALGIALALPAAPVTAAATCPFDTGGSDAINDGVVLTRYALGITGSPMTASTRYASLDPLQVKANIECVGCALDMNGDNQIDAVDATIIARHLAGFQGESLTAGLALGTGSRNSTAAVSSFLAIGCSMTGGTITSITAGNGLSGGTITASGTIAADTSYLQRRLASTCSAGSFITGVAADGTVSCAAPPAGGSGTVTNIATGAGLTGGPITATGTLSADTNFLQRRVASNCAAGSAISAIAADGTVSCAATGAPNAFVQGGNAFAAPGVLGTNDAQPLTVKTGGTDIKVVNFRGDGMRVTAALTATNTINGHFDNVSNAGIYGATVGGGGYPFGPHRISGNFGTVAGGLANTASYRSVVSGGEANSVDGPHNVISGRYNNVISASYSSILGGLFNSASGYSSTVVGGQRNIASGSESFAAGSYAEADQTGAFVWSDDSTNTRFTASKNWQAPAGQNTFNVRATGGVLFATTVNTTTGVPTTFCYMGVNGTGWICSSDRNVKERVESITPSRVLAGVLAMPVSKWSIIGSKVRQMGPMAQDFYRAFGLGDTDKAINSIDASGVAFAAIQGLNETVNQKLRSQQRLMRAKDQEIATLKSRLAAIEKRLGL